MNVRIQRTEAEKREYTRGYQRGLSRAYTHATFAFRMAKLYRAQAAALRRIMLGKDNWTARECQTCERWMRGGGLPNSESCKWGSCSAAFRAEAGEPFMWTEEPRSQITTHENFGCCNHLRDNPLRGERNGVHYAK